MSSRDEQARQILTLEARLSEVEAELAATRNVVTDALARVAGTVGAMADRLEAIAGNVDATADQVEALVRGERDRIRHVVNSDLRTGRGLGRDVRRYRG